MFEPDGWTKLLTLHYYICICNCQERGNNRRVALPMGLWRSMGALIPGERMSREAIHQALICCGSEPIEQREAIGAQVADQLEALFKIMANGARLRILHEIIRAGEICVNDLAHSIGMKPQAVSNQLQRLLDRGILGATRRGNRIFYRITNPCVAALLDYGLCILESEKGSDGKKD